MSKDAPEKRKTLNTKAHAGVVMTFAGNPHLGATQLLFTVYDDEWIAWYIFFEKSKRINAALKAFSTKGGPRGGVRVFGRKTLSVLYNPPFPMRVDEFHDPNARDENRAPTKQTPARLETMIPDDTPGAPVL